MLYQDRSRVDFMPNTNYVDGSINDIVHYDFKGYGAFGVDITGTISAGYLEIQGSSDGENWDTLFTVQDGEQVVSNQITNAMLPGHFSANIISYQMGRIIGLGSFAGNVKMTADIGVMPTQIVATVV